MLKRSDLSWEQRQAIMRELSDREHAKYDDMDLSETEEKFKHDMMDELMRLYGEGRLTEDQAKQLAKLLNISDWKTLYNRPPGEGNANGPGYA
jgi:hypothetical protein